jgi:hypothetical protein
MGQNLKNKFEEERSINYTRKADHEDLFIEKLYEELPIKKRFAFYQFRIAASIVILLGIGSAFYMLFNAPINNEKEITAFTLKNISPDLERIENFYVSNINNTLLEIQNTNNNLAFVARYMNRFTLLKKEYTSLIKEMNDEGPNTQSISSLINNLKLQLELLQELKEQITPVKNNLNETI